MKNSQLRSIARSDEWQYRYKTSKELNIDLFDNTKDLSKIQIIFLSYLSLYSSIAEAIFDDSENIDEIRSRSDFLVDAYLVHKKRHRNKKEKPSKQKINSSGIPSLSFVAGKKR